MRRRRPSFATCATTGSCCSARRAASTPAARASSTRRSSARRASERASGGGPNRRRRTITGVRRRSNRARSPYIERHGRFGGSRACFRACVRVSWNAGRRVVRQSVVSHDSTRAPTTKMCANVRVRAPRRVSRGLRGGHDGRAGQRPGGARAGPCRPTADRRPTTKPPPAPFARTRPPTSARARVAYCVGCRRGLVVGEQGAATVVRWCCRVQGRGRERAESPRCSRRAREREPPLRACASLTRERSNDLERVRCDDATIFSPPISARRRVRPGLVAAGGCARPSSSARRQLDRRFQALRAQLADEDRKNAARAQTDRAGAALSQERVAKIARQEVRCGADRPARGGSVWGWEGGEGRGRGRGLGSSLIVTLIPRSERAARAAGAAIAPSAALREVYGFVERHAATPRPPLSAARGVHT